MVISLGVMLIAGASSAQTPPIPELAAWESRMLTYGQTWCDYFDSGDNNDQKLGATYYDSQKVFQLIATYTGDTDWLTCADKAETYYRDLYVIPNGALLPGYWIFTTGSRMDWERDADATSKTAVVDISENANYCRDSQPIEWSEAANNSREVSYCIIALTNAEMLGETHRARLDLLIDQALDHIDQWFITKDYVTPADYPVPGCVQKYSIVPFMVGLTVDALIRSLELGADARVKPAVKTALDALWAEAWDGTEFWYENCKTLPGDAWPNPAVLPDGVDLNLLIVRGFQWLYDQGEGVTYRNRADAIFEKGVQGAYLGSGKHFNQNYAFSFDYVNSRLGEVSIPHLRTLSISQGPTYASFTVGMPELAYETDCAIVVKEGVTTIETITSTEGLASRILQTSVALDASTAYTATQSCTGAETDTNTYNFTTKATPAGGDRTVPIQVGDAPTYPDVARVTIRYDDNPALSTPATQQNASCPGACVVNLTLAAGRWYYRVERQDSGDNVLAVGSVQSLSIP